MKCRKYIYVFFEKYSIAIFCRLFLKKTFRNGLYLWEIPSKMDNSDSEFVSTMTVALELLTEASPSRIRSRIINLSGVCSAYSRRGYVWGYAFGSKVLFIDWKQIRNLPKPELQRKCAIMLAYGGLYNHLYHSKFHYDKNKWKRLCKLEAKILGKRIFELQKKMVTV